MRQSRGFTLIELLVVVTIIVVLLALLTPALDRAVYQAELAVCAANQKTIAMGVNVYAMSHSRHYPNRLAVQDDDQSNQLNDPWNGGDDRPLMKQYVPLAAYLDPLCDKLDLSPEATQPHKTSNGATDSPQPFVYSGFYLLYTWRYIDTPGQLGAMKPGDKFTWTGTNMFNKTGAWTFDVLTSDQNSRTTGSAICSHPDSDGKLALDTKRNEAYPSNTAIAGVNEGFYFVASRWGMANVSYERGTEDINTARSDGSVSRINGVAWDEDDRVTSAPIAINGPGLYGYWLILPQ